MSELQIEKNAEWNPYENHEVLIERLQSENATLRKDAAIGAVVWKFIDRMNDVAPECGDSAERILSEFVAAVMPEFNSAMER